MILNHVKKDTLDYIVIDDLYSEEELRLINTELIEIEPYLQPVEIIKSASKNHVYIKDCMSIWVDDFYVNNRDASNILRINRKLFSKEIISFAEKINAFYSYIRECDEDYTLINYYKTGQKYKSHKDASVLSAITFIELGSINGGGLIFTDFNEHIPFKNNRMIIFPGCVSHETAPINTDINSYRISIAQFLGYHSDR
jgi:Rps23 Pro-64 3,4-dihydroxylase Tpa1-like proline 4-hydroxylase